MRLGQIRTAPAVPRDRSLSLASYFSSMKMNAGQRKGKKNGSLGEGFCGSVTVWEKASVGAWWCGRGLLWERGCVGEWRCKREMVLWKNASLGILALWEKASMGK